MAEAGTVSPPRYHRVLLAAGPVLLILYLLTAAVVYAAAATGHIRLEPMTAAYSLLPAIAFAVPAWTAHRRRRSTDPERRHELFRKAVAELVVSLILLAGSLYQVLTVPSVFYTVL
jgi:hypothetical protein